MSKNNLPELTFDERRKLAAQVKSLRGQAGLKQSELAELAGVTRQSLSNIERGTVPQIDNLRRIYEVLGVDIAPKQFSAGTQQWLAIIGGILDTLPEDRRARAGKSAVEAVTAELVSTSNVGSESQTGDLRKDDHALAAKKRSRNRGEISD